MPAPLKTVADFRISAIGSPFPESDSHILALANGQFDVAWSQDRTADHFWDTDVRIMRVNADGTAALPRSATPISPSDTAESDASVTTLGSLQVIAYTDRGSPGTPGAIYLNFYDAAALQAGAFNGKSVVVEAGRDSSQPEVAALTNGNLAVTWYDSMAGTVKARVYDTALDRFTATSATLSSTTSAGSPDPTLTALSSGNFAVTWNDGYGSARLRLLDDKGGFLSGDLYISSGTTRGISIAELANGDLALASITGGQTYIQIFDLDGAAPVRLSTSIVGQGPAAVALTALDDGRLMVVWARGGQILGSIVRADGTLDAGSFVITSGSETLARPDIETLADGRVAVSYEKAGAIFSTVLDPREAGVTLAGTAGADQFVGTRFADHFSMGEGNDRVVAGAGNDVINGGAGADRMEGGLGNDTYYVGNSKDVVVELAGQGTDTVRSSISHALADNVEKLILTGSAVKAVGNGLDNALTGNAADNQLDGRGGADTMTGLGGNDSYYVDNALDKVVEADGGGIDTVFSSVSYSLAAHVERLTLTGTAAIDADGNDLDNVLTGNGAANRLVGGAGADKLAGGGGDDLYFAVDAADTIVEGANGGVDTVIVLSDFTLNAGARVEKIGSVYIGNRVTLNLTGNEFGQTIEGTAGSNVLDGKGGADVLSGFYGSDAFAFTTALGAGNVDRITDFSNAVGDDDRFMLGSDVFSALPKGWLSADAFTANAAGVAQDASDRIVYETDTGKLFYDANGSAAGGLVQFAVIDGKPVLTAADFIVI